MYVIYNWKMDDKLENQNWTPFLLILKIRCLFVKYNTVILMKKFKSFTMGFQYQLKENWKLSLSNLILSPAFPIDMKRSIVTTGKKNMRQSI